MLWCCVYSWWIQLIKSWTISGGRLSLFLSSLTFICNSIKSQSDIFHFLFTSGQNHIQILLVSCRERCCRWGCACVWNSCNEEQQARWNQIVLTFFLSWFSCSLTSLFVFPSLFLSLSLKSGIFICIFTDLHDSRRSFFHRLENLGLEVNMEKWPPCSYLRQSHKNHC